MTQTPTPDTAVAATHVARLVLAAALLASLSPVVAPVVATAQSTADLHATIDAAAADVEERVIAWRRDIHERPELSNREFETAGKVAAHLRSLGLEVETEVAHTGVIGILRGGRPGGVVALRADMDALPVTELADVPFASRVRAEYDGREVGVMHACGHDAHTAILMGVAEVLTGMREQIPGTVKFLFQPAEEGPPSGEAGGASLMVAEGALENPRPGAIFGLHVTSRLPTGVLAVRPRGAMASADSLRIEIEGSQTHGAMPWLGVDPITAAGHVLVALQTIPARRLDPTLAPSVVSIGRIEGGVRGNIIPASVSMVGTIRTLEPAVQDRFHELIVETVEHAAATVGATATVEITRGAPVTFNDPDLTARSLPTLERVAVEPVLSPPPTTGAEDFPFFTVEVPGVYFFLGVTPPAQLSAAAPNHSPYFFVDETALLTGVRAIAHLAIDYLTSAAN